MAKEIDHVQNEIDIYLHDLDSWIKIIKNKSVSSSRKGVSERFVRDCEILKDDLKTSVVPSCLDLVDFTDRYNSLEVQFQLNNT